MCKYHVLVLIASFASATIIYVPGQYPTIQQGLNAAQSNDTVLVAAGTYPENINWPSIDGIQLMSESGTEATIIDGNAVGPHCPAPGLADVIDDSIHCFGNEYDYLPYMYIGI